MRVILKLDVYKHDSEGRRWERQVWVGSYPDKPDASECDSLVLLKEYENGNEHILFRLDEYKKDKNEAVYRPTILHSSDSFLKSLSKWGFVMEPVVNVEKV